MPPSSPSSSDDLKRTGPSTPRTVRGLKRFYPLSFRRTSKGWQVQVRWKRLAIFLLLAGGLGWLGLASGAYVFVKYRRGFTDVRYTDMLLLPFRWHAYQIAKGDFFIRTAQDQLKDGKYGQAFQALRIGVAKDPANKDGRLLLAQFYGAWKRTDLAEQTLLDGLPYHRDDQSYLKLLFSFLLQRQEDEKTLALCKDLLGKDRTRTPRNQLVAMAAASASFFRGNYDQAEDDMSAFGLESTRDGRLLSARIAWERGLKDIALAQLGQLASDFPDDEEIYSQSVSYLRDAGRDGEARRESLLRSLSHPRDARARIDLLYALHKEGDSAAVKTNVDEIFQDFAGDANALLALADFAANTGDAALAKRVYDYALARKLNWEGAALMMVEANVVAKNYQAALNLVRRLLKENPEWAKRYYTVFNGLQAIAYYGLGDAESAQLFLNNFLTQTNVRAENLVAVSKRLADVGARAQARQVLAQAVKTDAPNQAALTGLIKLDLALDNTDTLAASVRTLLGMRKPPKDVLNAAYRKLGSDLFLFSPGRLALLEDLRNAIATDPARS